ncbi:MAG: cofactor-independent phosphoglycerate mutase [Clostridiales bacterium]|jgi:2,3-bisphosphoglycerate-independent phosphoglycerate mutase|nr:cofactor-independent phosphoglycerate mutase [Clostridiales bacterium]
MKYLILLGDGMADYPVEELGGKTPLEAARKPNMDFLSRRGKLGLARTLFEGMPTGSDVANMCVLGYDPRKYYSGRSPIEALGLGVHIAEDDMVFRLNLVSLSVPEDNFLKSVMLDYSADKITTSEAEELLHALNAQIPEPRLYLGVSYRHVALWKGIEQMKPLTPPHDFHGKEIGPYMPDNLKLAQYTRQCHEILKDHPVNLLRGSKGLKPANGVWLWGEGRRAAFDSFYERHGLRGSVVTAVPLITGLAVGMGLGVNNVDGATGDIGTNFRGKAEAALTALRNGDDFVFLHIEAPDECGHEGNALEKTRSIELIDELTLGPLLEGLDKLGEPYRLMLMPDHATPVSLRTHTPDLIPFVIFDSRTAGCKGNASDKTPDNGAPFTEACAKETGVVENGYDLIERLFIK